MYNRPFNSYNRRDVQGRTTETPLGTYVLPTTHRSRRGIVAPPPIITISINGLNQLFDFRPLSGAVYDELPMVRLLDSAMYMLDYVSRLILPGVTTMRVSFTFRTQVSADDIAGRYEVRSLGWLNMVQGRPSMEDFMQLFAGHALSEERQLQTGSDILIPLGDIHFLISIPRRRILNVEGLRNQQENYLPGAIVGDRRTVQTAQRRRNVANFNGLVGWTLGGSSQQRVQSRVAQKDFFKRSFKRHDIMALFPGIVDPSGVPLDIPRSTEKNCVSRAFSK